MKHSNFLFHVFNTFTFLFFPFCYDSFVFLIVALVPSFLISFYRASSNILFAAYGFQLFTLVVNFASIPYLRNYSQFSLSERYLLPTLTSSLIVYIILSHLFRSTFPEYFLSTRRFGLKKFCDDPPIISSNFLRSFFLSLSFALALVSLSTISRITSLSEYLPFFLAINIFFANRKQSIILSVLCFILSILSFALIESRLLALSYLILSAFFLFSLKPPKYARLINLLCISLLSFILISLLSLKSCIFCEFRIANPLSIFQISYSTSTILHSFTASSNFINLIDSMNISHLTVALDNLGSALLSSSSTVYSPNTFVSQYAYSIGGSLPFAAFMPNPYIFCLIMLSFAVAIYIPSKSVLLSSTRSRHFFVAILTIYCPRWIFYNSSLLIRFIFASFLLIFILHILSLAYPSRS
ncbi:putative membrane protein [Synechococcus sp. WH 8103]|nr:putative membrane protein [Synechococcus sp. WH 8103]